MAFDSLQPSAPGANAQAALVGPGSMVRRIFSKWGNSPTGTNPTPMEMPINENANAKNNMSAARSSAFAPCWWTCSVNAVEVVRKVEGAVPVHPLRYDQIRSQGYPSSKLWAQVGFFREGIGRMVVMDVAQGQRIGTDTTDVGMKIIYPPGAIANIRGDQPEDLAATLQGPGLFLDTILRTSVVPSTAPGSFAPHTLTFTALVGPNATYVIPCPPGAIAVDIFVPGGQTVEGMTAIGAWLETYTLSAALVGGVDFSGISSDRSMVVDRPGNAAAFVAVNTSLSTLSYTFVWHLEF